MSHIRLGGEREQGMLHRGHVVLRHHIGNIEDEKVLLGMSVGEQGHPFALAKLVTSGTLYQAAQQARQVRYIRTLFWGEIHSLVSEPRFVSFGTQIR